MKKHTLPSTRVRILVALMAMWTVGIGARLYFLQVVQSESFREKAQTWQQDTLDIPPRRGVIFDRNGNVLAVSIKVEGSVFATPSEIKNPEGTARALAAITGESVAPLLQRLSSKKSFVWVKRKISDSERSAIKRAALPGIHFQEEFRRFYPKRQLAAHVLGSVDVDEKGSAGLELRYNSLVHGEPGKIVLMTDARGKSFQREEQPPQAGADLVTTLDGTIQHWVEKELQEAAVQTRAAGISIVVMDPHSGAILAMANYPTFNPNEIRKYSTDRRRNRAVSDYYEPGSTFKIVTAAAALEENLTTPDERIDCLNGSIVLYNHRIRDHKKFGVLSVREIMQYSSDVGMIKLGLRVGNERFADYIDRLGFGRLTAIDLPAEENGSVQPASRWSKISIGAISMGQEIGVTPLQIVSMVSAVANGGILYRPYVVEKIQDPRQGITETTPIGKRVLSLKTAEQLQEMLEVVVTDGTAKGSKLEGYRAAGKTGTAQKIDPRTRTYSNTKYVASFAGFAPASNPQVAIVVMVDEPSGNYHGGEVAAPIFKRIAEQVLRSRSVVPDIPQYAPRYTVTPKKPEKPVPSKNPETRADWKVVPASMVPSEVGEIEVPDFYGQSLRQVTTESLRLGIKLQPAGSGRATSQFPQPGTRVRSGARVQVRFSVR